MNGTRPVCGLDPLPGQWVGLGYACLDQTWCLATHNLVWPYLLKSDPTLTPHTRIRPHTTPICMPRIGTLPLQPHMPCTVNRTTPSGQLSSLQSGNVALEEWQLMLPPLPHHQISGPAGSWTGQMTPWTRDWAPLSKLNASYLLLSQVTMSYDTFHKLLYMQWNLIRLCGSRCFLMVATTKNMPLCQ